MYLVLLQPLFLPYLAIPDLLLSFVAFLKKFLQTNRNDNPKPGNNQNTIGPSSCTESPETGITADNEGRHISGCSTNSILEELTQVKLDINQLKQIVYEGKMYQTQ